MKKVLILENIRSVHNVGAIFRTADAIGIDKIYLVGQTASPVDRFGRARADLHKAALGAEENLIWEYFADVDAAELVKKMKNDNCCVVALEQSENSTDYKNIDLPADGKNIAVVFGNEVEGVSRGVMENADIIAEIPMCGKKESLNVSVAAGVFHFRLFDK